MTKTKRLCTLAISLALSLLLSFVEHQIPPLVTVPGVKIGLANVVTVFLLYALSAKDAFCVSILRVLLSSLLFGSIVSMIYALSGALLSFFVMLLFKKLDFFSEIGVSVLGGVFHNIGQIISAIFVLGTASIAYYLPVLLISGVISGAVIGIISGLIIKRLKNKI